MNNQTCEVDNKLPGSFAKLRSSRGVFRLGLTSLILASTFSFGALGAGAKLASAASCDTANPERFTSTKVAFTPPKPFHVTLLTQGGGTRAYSFGGQVNVQTCGYHARVTVTPYWDGTALNVAFQAPVVNMVFKLHFSGQNVWKTFCNTNCVFTPAPYTRTDGYSFGQNNGIVFDLFGGTDHIDNVQIQSWVTYTGGGPTFTRTLTGNFSTVGPWSWTKCSWRGCSNYSVASSALGARIYARVIDPGPDYVLGDGLVVRENSNPTVFVLNGDMRRPLTAAAFTAAGYTDGIVTWVPDGTLSAYVDMPAEGALFRSVSNATVYVMRAGAKFALTYNEFVAGGYNWGAIATAADSYVASIPNRPFPSTLLRERSNATVWRINEVPGKTALTADAFAAGHYLDSNVVFLPDDTVVGIPDYNPVIGNAAATGPTA